MADKNKKFTVKSDKVLGEKSKEKDIVVDVPNTSLKGQSSTPSISANFKETEISTSVSYGVVSTKTDNINIEVDLKGLGEERQPDSTKFIFKPDEVDVSDHQSYVVDKQAIPELVRLDDTFNYFNLDLGKFDEISSIDKFSVDYSKPFFDNFNTQEFIEKELAKSSIDNAASKDQDSKLIAPNKFEVVSTPERVEQVFYKSIFDAISITDDVNGVLPDDDQTALIQDRNFDTSGVEDFSYRHIYKGLVDTVNLVETFRAEDGTIKDNSSIADIFIASLFKTADNDSTSTDDKIVFDSNIGKLDTATTNDILSTVITFLRSFEETTSAADSGRLNSQNYFSEEYVWEDYVGTNSYF
jgi:hypothetical protein